MRRLEIVEKVPLASENVWTLASKVSDEVSLDSMLQSQGPNQSRFLERLEKNQRSAHSMSRGLKVLYVCIFSVVAIMPLLAIIQVTDLVQYGDAPATILFSVGMILGFDFVLEMVYLLILGVINLGSLFAGDVFKWLETLPISRSTRQKVGFLAAFRSFDAALVTMVVALPVIVSIFTRNIFLTIACLGVSILHVMLVFSILIIVSERFGRFTRGSANTTGRANVVRVITMVVYVMASIGISILIQIAIRSTSGIIAFFISIGSIPEWDLLFSLIPYPFAGGYLVVAAAMNPASIPLSMWICIIVGIGILILITWAAFRRAMHMLRNLVVGQGVSVGKESASGVPIKEKLIEFAPRTPYQAFRKKDLSTATRDVQTLTYLIMPLMLPFISLIPTLLSSPTSGANSDLGLEFFIFWFILTLLSVFSAGTMTIGLLNIESTGASILATLPILVRDQAKAKLSIMVPIQLVGFLLPTFLFLTNPSSFVMLVAILASIPLVITILLTTFLLKVRLFGKLRYRYVLEEARMNKKFSKWILIFLADGVIWAAFTFPAFPVFGSLDLRPILPIWLISGGLGILICLYAFHRMFSRPRNLRQ